MSDGHKQGVFVEYGGTNPKTYGDTTPVPLPSNDAPLSLGVAAPGTDETYARGDHRHAHGDQAGGDEHDIAVGGASDGFMSSADKTAFDIITQHSAGPWPPTQYPFIGFCYLDTTVPGTPIPYWWNGTDWFSASGAPHPPAP